MGMMICCVVVGFDCKDSGNRSIMVKKHDMKMSAIGIYGGRAD
jgi:hypothetical protein